MPVAIETNGPLAGSGGLAYCTRYFILFEHCRLAVDAFALLHHNILYCALFVVREQPVLIAFSLSAHFNTFGFS